MHAMPFSALRRHCDHGLASYSRVRRHDDACTPGADTGIGLAQKKVMPKKQTAGQGPAVSARQILLSCRWL
jgi:hypothetical protein